MLRVAEDVLDLCPQALFFNYGNPIAAVCRGVWKAISANVIALCHGVPHTAGYRRWECTHAGWHTKAQASSTWRYDFQVDGQDASEELGKIAVKQAKNVEN
jgi:alpha-galactosidase